MPYKENNYYHLQINNKNLNVYGNANASNNANINIWDQTKSNDQIFKIKLSKSKSGDIKGAYLLSAINERFGLNILRTTNNCDIYPIKGNLNDSLLDFVSIDSETNLYRVKLVHHNLYLTAQGDKKNANVSWEALDDENEMQIWKFSKATPKPVANNSQAKTDAALSNSSYIWPTVSKRITQYFKSMHKGIDVGGVTPGVDGDDLYAFCSGKVVRVFNWTPSNGKTGNASMGNAVFIHSLNPKPNIGGKYLRTLYMHLENPTHLKVGDTVKKGDIIGKMGNTGRSFGTHLHFGMQADNSNFNPSGGSTYYINNYFVNPLLYFK